MIIIKKEKEIELMRQGGKILSQILKKIIIEIRPGAATGDLEKMACALIEQVGGRPAFKGYKSGHDDQSFPNALCTSFNNEVVHAPSVPSRELRSGDIIGLDLGMEYPYSSIKRGYYTDMATTVIVGKVSRQAQKLLKVTKEALNLGIKQAMPGNTLNNIGKAIEQYVHSQGFSVVRDLVGHGVGREIHEEPQIPNYDMPGNDKIILKPGMTLAIEPMVNAGGWEVKNGDDNFTILTADGSLSAHFEHTVLVTKSGHEILTEF